MRNITRDELPEQLTHAQLREANRKHWEQPGGSTFANGTPANPPAPAPIRTRNNPNAVPVPAEVGGAGRAEVPRAQLVAQGHEGPLGMGRQSALERGEPRQTTSGLKPIASGEGLPASLNHAQLAAYSNRPDRNYSGASTHTQPSVHVDPSTEIAKTPSPSQQGVKNWGGE
jgi:hypothetical protein